MMKQSVRIGFAVPSSSVLSRQRSLSSLLTAYCTLPTALCLLLTAHCTLPTDLYAQVPGILNYQGRVVVNGTNFTGTGQFKFALVDGSGTTTYWSNDGTSVGGNQPAASNLLTVTKGLYSVLLGDATLPNMTAIPAAVFTNSDVRRACGSAAGAACSHSPPTSASPPTATPSSRPPCPTARSPAANSPPAP